MTDSLLLTRYENDTNTSLSSRKSKINKLRKDFVLKTEQLFHSKLYGEMPTAFVTPLLALEPYCGDLPTRLVPFNVAYANKDYQCTVHFYIDDQGFLRVLRNPEKYLPFFKRCHSVIGTDLSQYAEMSPEDRYFSAYINSAFSAYLQRNGVKVIPNVTWSLPDSFCYSWSSLPKNSVIAINCKGIMKHDASKYLWMKGYECACNTLHPSHIIRYGTIMPNENTTISLYFENERLNYMRHGR